MSLFDTGQDGLLSAIPDVRRRRVGLNRMMGPRHDVLAPKGVAFPLEVVAGS